MGKKLSKDLKNGCKLQSKLLALSVRNSIEDLHSQGIIPQSKMKEFNTLIRDSIYSTLLLFNKAKNGDKNAETQLILLTHSIPEYWEEPKEIK